MVSAIIVSASAAAIALLMIKLSALSIGVACTMLACPFIVMRPELYFVLFLLTRPIVDVAASRSIAGVLNPAALYTVLLIIVCGALITRKQSIRTVLKNRVLMNFNRIFLLFPVSFQQPSYQKFYCRFPAACIRAGGGELRGCIFQRGKEVGFAAEAYPVIIGGASGNGRIPADFQKRPV